MPSTAASLVNGNCEEASAIPASAIIGGLEKGMAKDRKADGVLERGIGPPRVAATAINIVMSSRLFVAPATLRADRVDRIHPSTRAAGAKVKVRFEPAVVT